MPHERPTVNLHRRVSDSVRVRSETHATHTPWWERGGVELATAESPPTHTPRAAAVLCWEAAPLSSQHTAGNHRAWHREGEHLPADKLQHRTTRSSMRSVGPEWGTHM